MHRSLQTALLLVAGSWSWQSTAAGFGGRGSWSWYLITVVPDMLLHFSHIGFLCRLWIQWHQTKNALATLLNRWCCPTFCCCCTRSPPVRILSKTENKPLTYHLFSLLPFLYLLQCCIFGLIHVFLHHLGRQMVLETLYALTSNTKIVKEAMAKGQCNSIFCSIFMWILSAWMLMLICLFPRCTDLLARPLL